MASNRSYTFSNQCLRPHVQNGSGHWLAKKESSNLSETTFSRENFYDNVFFLSQNQFITSKNKMLNIAVIVENITNHNILTLTPLLKPKFPRPPLEIYVLALDSHTNVADINRMRGTPLIPYYKLVRMCFIYMKN